MYKVSFFRKLKLLKLWKKTLNENRSKFRSDYGIEIDNAYRMYTVLNIPQEYIGDSYTLRKADIDRIADSYIKEYTAELSKFLKSIGLVELSSFYDTQKVDKFSYLIVYGFSLIRTEKYYKNLLLYFYPTLCVLTLSIISYFIFFLK